MDKKYIKNPGSVIRERIVYNLKDLHHGKMVNYSCVVRGVENIDDVQEVLTDLIANNIIKMKTFRLNTKNNRVSTVRMYKYNFFSHNHW